MAVVSIRTVFEQPVNTLRIKTFLQVVRTLCVLLWVGGGVAGQDGRPGQQPAEYRGVPQQQQQALPHYRPLCPDGWVRGSVGDQSFKDKDASLCLYMSPQALTWTQARRDCHSRDSVLLSLDSVLSVEDRLFQQYLKDKGVSDIWTGMHKDGGRQIWDEPGKGMVVAYTGSQRTVGQAIRGWRWDRSSFSDATLTCGVYAYTADQALSAERKRRDTDTPSPTSVSRSSSDSPGREDPQGKNARGPTEKNMDAFKNFLSDQGMTSFADKLNDNPSETTQSTTPPSPEDKGRGATAGVEKKTNSSDNKKDGRSDTASDAPSRVTTETTPSDSMNDMHGNGAGDTGQVKEKEKLDSPSDDKNGQDKAGNGTLDLASSDEEDNNHDMVKRSTPTINIAVTTDNPGLLINVTAASNLTTLSTLNTTGDNSTTPISPVTESSSQANDTSLTGPSKQGSGFSKEVMDFFKPSSREASNARPQQAESNAREIPSTQDIFDRFQTGPGKVSSPLVGGETQAENPSAMIQPAGGTPVPQTRNSQSFKKESQVPRTDSNGTRIAKQFSAEETGSAPVAVADGSVAVTPANAAGTTRTSLIEEMIEKRTTTMPGNNAALVFRMFRGSGEGSDARSTSTENPVLTSTSSKSQIHDAIRSKDSNEGTKTTTTTVSPADSGDAFNLSSGKDQSDSSASFNQRFGPPSTSSTTPYPLPTKTVTLTQQNGEDLSKPAKNSAANDSTELKSAGNDSSEVIPAGHDVSQLTSAGNDSTELKSVGNDSREVIPAGLDTIPLTSQGNNSTELTSSGNYTSKPTPARNDSSEVMPAEIDSGQPTSAGNDSSELTPTGIDRADMAFVGTDQDQPTSAGNDSREAKATNTDSRERTNVLSESNSNAKTKTETSPEIRQSAAGSAEIDTNAGEMGTNSTDSAETGNKTSADNNSAEVTTASAEDSAEVSTTASTTAAANGVWSYYSSTQNADSAETGTRGQSRTTSSSKTGSSSSGEQGSTLAQLKDILNSMTPRPDNPTPPSAHSWMTLQHCEQKHQFVCAAKPVHNFLRLSQCPEGWLGHSLVSRCYRVISQPATMSEARDQCRSQGGALATADTSFFTNVTRLLVDRLALLHSFASQMWIDTGSSGQDGQCSVLEAQVQQLQRRSCSSKLPYFCQRPTAPPPPPPPTYAGNGDDDDEDDDRQMLDTPAIILNMSSWNPQHIVCPLNPRHHADLVVWYKDGRPIPTDSEDTSIPRSTNTRNPHVLQLNMHLLRRLGLSEQRTQKPAMLQGLYWCRVWTRHPLRSRTSNHFYVRFQDVITLQGFIKTSEVTVAEAVFFNEMADHSGLAGTIESGLQRMNDRIYPGMQPSQPFLSDVLTYVHHADAETEEVEFRTYLCLSTEAMAPQDKGAVVDSYLKALHIELVASEDLVRRDWNLSLPFEEAFRLLMTEMCPESRLTDKVSGHEATFPSTPVNEHALSIDNCDGLFTGYARCSGDLQSGAHWSHWEVDTSCYDNDQHTDSSDSDKREPDKVNLEDVVNTGDGFSVPSKPNSGLLVIDEVHIEPENVADVTDRLADILDTSVDLTDVDVEIVADVIDRVALVPILPQDVGLTLLKTVNRVLDSPLQTLQTAQRRTQASTRILKDLDEFSGKLDFGQRDHVRYVTPNIAMEVWNMRAAREPVIGLAATVGRSRDDPLSQSRIITLSNRTWNDMHMLDFDVAIELPDQLVSGGDIGNGRLSMAVYHKPGLFLSSLQPISEDGEGDVPPPELNSAIISATLASHSVTDLQDNVRLIFRPLKQGVGDNEATRCVYWDFSLPAGGGWSSKGCKYDGSVQGRDICLCDHLTNFAVLLDFYGDTRPMDEANTTALSIITIIGLSLSIMGLALTVVTFIFFKKLRQGRAQQTLFHMSVALLCSEVVLLAGLKQTTHYGFCLAVAILLHYFILASFLWMLIEAVLQYLTFVKVLGTYISKYTLKTVLPAWGIPLLPVISVLATDYTQYRGRRDYCWMNLDAFYYAFALPVGVIILFNLVTFVVIMISLLRRPEGLRSTRNKGNTAETNIKAAFTIFILLGLTWTFGYLAIADARLPFQYMFTVFSSLQGFLIFVLLVARRRQFREQWKAMCCGRIGPVRGQKVTPTLSNSASSQSSSSSFSSSSRSRSGSDGSSKTMHSLIKRADSNVSRTKVQPQLSSKGPTVTKAR